MHTSGSYIKTALERVRFLINEAVMDSKYSDDYITRNGLSTAMNTLFSRAMMLWQCPVRCRFYINLVIGQEYYTLPQHIQQVTRICSRDTQGNLVWDWKPRHEMNRHMAGWAIDGNELRVNPLPSINEQIEVWYVPSATSQMHYAADGNGVTSHPEQFTLSSAPSVGVLGKMENEYVGYYLRVLSGDTFCQRIITAYDPATRKVTLRTALPSVPGSNVAYEIVPPHLHLFWQAASTLAAYELGISRKVAQNTLQELVTLHKSDIKTLRDTLAMEQSRMPYHVERDTIDNLLQGVVWEKDGW